MICRVLVESAQVWMSCGRRQPQAVESSGVRRVTRRAHDSSHIGHWNWNGHMEIGVGIGLDSLAATELVRMIAERHSTELPASWNIAH